MKLKKCTRCGKSAKRKFRGVILCTDCVRAVKKVKAKYVLGEVLIGSFGQGVPVYTDVLHKLK